MSEFYGDDFRWFIGTVEDNSDPLRLGRVRVRISGIHTESQLDIPTGDLPWAQVALPGTSPGVSGLAESIQLQPGARVFGFFFDGEASQLPMVMGSLPQIEYASPQQELNFVDDALKRKLNPQSTGPGTGISGEKNTTQNENQAARGGSGSSNAEIAYNFFLEKGFEPHQAAGIVGNLMQESGPGMSTTIKSAGSEQSFGIAQWNSAKAAGNRLGLLKEFAKELGKDWTELEVQLRFIIYELEKFSYLGLSELRAARTVEEATFAFMTKYERPSEQQLANRVGYAKDVLVRYS